MGLTEVRLADSSREAAGADRRFRRAASHAGSASDELKASRRWAAHCSAEALPLIMNRSGSIGRDLVSDREPDEMHWVT